MTPPDPADGTSGRDESTGADDGTDADDTTGVNETTSADETIGGTPGPRETASACIASGIEAADPEQAILDALTLPGSTLHIDQAGAGSVDSGGSHRESLDLDAFERIVVLGGGNAAGRVASGLEAVFGDRIDSGVVVTDAPTETDRIDQLPGDHPVPSDRGVQSTRRLVELAETADPETLALVAITGGGSALMPAPADGIDLDALQSVTDALLRSGAPIEDVNAVRKHLSDVKGGRLAAALAPARVVTLAFSDVVGNRLDVIASGPTVPDPTTYADALDALARHDVQAPDSVVSRLEAGRRGEYEETPDESHPAFDRTTVHVLADNRTACVAARDAAIDAGYDAMVLTTRVTGPARDAATWHTAIAHDIADAGLPLAPPAVVVTGGETTVRVTGSGGTGGPNHEFALGAALDLPADAVVAAVDTDGIDGNSGVAGALVDATTVTDTASAEVALASNDTHPYLRARDAIIDTGVTGTNVNDLRVLVVGGQSEK